MQFLRRLFNWFKLFVALDFMVVATVLLASESDEFSKGPDRWGPLLGVWALMFGIGTLLFVWFMRIYKKHKLEFRKQFPNVLESPFYTRYPRFSKFMDGWSFNGFGSKFMTYAAIQEDGSCYATKWIMLGFFPAVPLYRQRIRVVSEKEKIHIPLLVSSSKLEFVPMERVALNSRHIRLTYLFYFLFFLPALTGPLVLGLIFLRELLDLLPGKSFWLALLIYFAWGIFLIFLTEVFNKRLFLKRKH